MIPCNRHFCLFSHLKINADTHMTCLVTCIGNPCTSYILMHYPNTTMQYTAIIYGCKNVHFQMKFFNNIFFAQNIDCGNTLEPPQ